MNKAIILAVMITVMGTTATNAEAVRLIVKEKSTSSISSLAGGQTKVLGAAKFKSITVESPEGGVEKLLGSLRESGQYESVEIDYMVSVPTPIWLEKAEQRVSGASTNDVPNDPWLSEQFYWNAQTETEMGHANILAAYQISNPTHIPRIGVLDSGFGNHVDLEYSEGYSFTTVYDRVRGPEFLAVGPLSDCSFGHGLSVASLIAAKTNNNEGIAGIVQSDIIAARVMYCGSGYLSDVATALYWMAGGTVEDVPSISSPVDIVNMSLSTNAEACPFYMQDAIDYAVDSGVIIVVGASNDSGDVADFSPANCNNVITVGAVDRRGQKANFSNIGEEVDLVAPGINIIIAGPDDQYYWGEGTSFSAPLVAGIAAMARAEFPSLVHSEIESLLVNSTARTASEFDSLDTSCENDGCGSGVVDGEAFLLATREYMGGDISFIKHALADGASCDENLYLDFFGTALKLCSMYEISFDSEATLEAGITYELYKIEQGMAFDLSNGTKILESEEPSIISGEISIDGSLYGYRVCTNGNCGDTLQRINSSNTAKPASCAE